MPHFICFYKLCLSLCRQANEFLHLSRLKLILMVKDLPVHGYLHIFHMKKSDTSLPDIPLHSQIGKEGKSVIFFQHTDDKGSVADLQHR